MAAKKVTKTKKKKKKALAVPGEALQPAAPAAANGAADNTLVPFSTPATPADVKNEVILSCIVAAFDAQGLKHISSPQDRVVWEAIPSPIIVALGDGITNCINGKGFACASLSPAFLGLKDLGQTTLVSNLVSGIATLVTP